MIRYGLDTGTRHRYVRYDLNACTRQFGRFGTPIKNSVHPSKIRRVPVYPTEHTPALIFVRVQITGRTAEGLRCPTLTVVDVHIDVDVYA